MASFKALCLASVASLAVTAAAHAADLLPPPPPVELPAVDQFISFGGSWYLRGDVGVGISDLRRRDSTFDTPVPGLEYNQTTLGDSAFVDAGVGYRINEYLRADITGEYRTSAQFNGIESYSTKGFCNGPCAAPRGYDTYSGSIQSVVGLVNGYIDLGTWYAVTPFIGGGVGFARVGVNNFVDVGTLTQFNQPGGFGYAGSHYQTNFAFALMAGLDFAVTQNLKMEIGYRYLDMGNVASGAIQCIGGVNCRETQHFHLASNDVRLGFRYTLSDFVPAPPPPLVRKY